MSDSGTTPREEPSDAAHDAVRDALPALVHGRVTASARARLERHLEGCPVCDAESQLLASVRELYPTPPISVDRIAAAVRARTVPVPVPVPAAPAGPADVARAASAAPASARRGVVSRGAPAWARRGTVRAFAASALLAVGSGAMLLHPPSAAPVRTAVAGPRVESPAAVATFAAPRDPNGSLLGANFSDLSDAELAAVVAAVDDPAAATPAAEPAPVAPAVLAPDGE